MSYNSNDRTTFQNSSSIATDEEKKVWATLEEVCDPEVPVLSVVDLGIIRKVTLHDLNNPVSDISPPSLTPPSGSQGVTITITPTYSGCPAMDVISTSIRMALLQNGFKDITINTVLSPAWTTEWMTEAGKQKLKAYGIAPPNPQQAVCSPDAFQQEEAIQCPQCNSFHTHLVSRFGSTACKALYQCDDCKEPFDYFKCH